MKQISLRRIAQLIGFSIVIVGLPFESHVARAQFPPTPFPVLQVDSAVRARLSEEWEPTNRYQRERGYCVRFSTEIHPASFWRPAFVVYTLTNIIRGEEVRASQHGLGGIGCPGGGRRHHPARAPSGFLRRGRERRELLELGSARPSMFSERH